MVLLAGLFTGGYYVGKWRLLVPASRVDTAAALPMDAQVMFRIDGASRELYRILQVGTGGIPPILLDSVLPHELSAAFSLRPSAADIDWIAAISTRRMVDFMAWRLDPALMLAGTAHREASLENSGGGLLLLRARRPLARSAPPGAEEVAVQPPLSLEKSQDIELLVDNRTGQAQTILAAFFEDVISPAHRAAPEQEGEWVSAELSQLASDPRAQLAALGRHVAVLRLTGRFLRQQTVEFTISVETNSLRDASAALLHLSMLRDHLHRSVLQRRMRLEGQWRQEEARITGVFVLTGYDPWAGSFLRGFF